ncbi:MAG: translation initiation factor [Nanoarchaeota archaeon]|nr:translation initiation factor [Nanoarchaeota archaeon]MBU1445016.1 translation initiation factor [Nanoarchaeota archaeon]MBU2420026.1 translation initiation factor [Nanoarchaeota archaeon]MBU2475494.1 translation initiation factor [Nanoarchaeota archaeon]MBU3940541.1 translation initiation factor [Nanoarchaeota archaeon]
MSDICPKCGLAKELCVCETIAKEEQRITIRIDKRRFGKLTTVIDGFEDIDIKDIAKKLKSKLACGGTFKGKSIELQGNHAGNAKKELINLGFNPNAIDIK